MSLLQNRYPVINHLFHFILYITVWFKTHLVYQLHSWPMLQLDQRTNWLNGDQNGHYKFCWEALCLAEQTKCNSWFHFSHKAILTTEYCALDISLYFQRVKERDRAEKACNNRLIILENYQGQLVVFTFCEHLVYIRWWLFSLFPFPERSFVCDVNIMEPWLSALAWLFSKGDLGRKGEMKSGEESEREQSWVWETMMDVGRG